MALNDNGLNSIISGLTSVASHLSLHTAEPSAAGSNEVSGGSYARKSISWAAASSGTAATDAQIDFDVPAGTTVAYIGYWSALSGGTFYGSRALDASQTFANAGTFTITSGNLVESAS